MMLPTHILAGGLIGVLIGFLYPGQMDLFITTGMIGGAMPDVDLVFEHRKTLHFPINYTVAAALLLTVAAITAPPHISLIATLLLTAGIHSITDVFGGGKELRPWQRTDDRAVYNHRNRQWITARRYIYDGSWQDALFMTCISLPVYLHADGLLRTVTVTLVMAGLLYALLRRRVARLIPDRYPTYSSLIKDLLAR